MGVFRTYFSKDNTIIKGKYVNTGLNPVVELFFGTLETSASRYIFDFDVTAVKNRINDFRIPNNGTVKHTLKMVNTLLYDKHLLGEGSRDFRDSASSFDLVLFSVPASWDEGTGYDYSYNTTLVDINPKIYETSSNWFQRTDVTNWAEPGIYSGTTSSNYLPLQTIHFDLGDEDIEIDITSLVAGLITSGQTNFHGLGLAFTAPYEAMRTDKLYTVGFFGKDTNSYWEPCIETTWTEEITDDRNEFCFGKNNKLYLYSNIRKEPTNLDHLPTSVEIRDYNDELILTITGITHESKGVYSVSVDLDDTYSDISLVNFTDTWKGIVINGKTISDVEQTFTLKENNYFNIGTEVFEPEDFGFNFSGLKRGENINRGEVRKIVVEVRKMYSYDNLVIDGLSYRLYVKQGRNEIDIVPFCEINKAFNQNYFYLDTSWLIPQVYFLELTLLSNGTTTKKDSISFTVVDNYSGNIDFNL